MTRRRAPARLIFLFLMSLLLGLTPARGQAFFAAIPGDATEGKVADPPVVIDSTLSGFQVGFAQEYGKTTIWLRICADAPNVQLRSELVGGWSTEVFHRTAASGGCSPSAGSWWRMVYNIDPGTGAVFRIYGTANDAVLPEAAFMQRAGRTNCVVTGYGVGTCTPANPLFPAPAGAVEAPGEGATLSGTGQISGWAVDAGSWAGPGVSEVGMSINGTDIGLASYGGARGDVASALGDSRFTNSQYQHSFDTTRFPNGPATIQVRYRSALNGAWTTMERRVTIANSSPNQAPNPPVLLEPANSATLDNPRVNLRVQDAGDPDNGPRSFRSYTFRIKSESDSWSAESGWITSTTWAVTLPGPGAYQWQAMAFDGAGASAWAGPRSFVVRQPAPSDTILPVRYVDQVFAQRTPLNNWWVYCGPSTLAMLLHYYGVEKRDVFTDRAPTVELAREMGVSWYGTPGGAIPAALQRRGLGAAQRTLSADELRASIVGGHPVLISTRNPNHIFLIIGVRANGTFVVHDPMGGRFWGPWSRTANRNDVPWKIPFDTPRTRGATLPTQNAYVEYSYADFAAMGIKYMLRVTGAAPRLQVASAQVNTTNGIFNGQGLQLRFGSSSRETLADAGVISLTHTPQRAPEYAFDGYVNPLAAFRLSALDSNQRQLKQLAQPYTLRVAIDPTIFDAWGDRSGASAGEMEAPRPTILPQLVTDALVVVVWDEATGAWVELPTTVDPETHHVSAKTTQFGDFAVVVRPDRIAVFLPLTMR